VVLNIRTSGGPAAAETVLPLARHQRRTMLVCIPTPRKEVFAHEQLFIASYREAASGFSAPHHC
jgi:hypothetical protein